MSDKEGRHKTIELSGGEILYLTKDPGGKWMIDFYECHQGANGLAFKQVECRPQQWKKLEFESAAEAEAFVEREIREGKVLGNRSQKKTKNGERQNSRG